MNLPYPLIPLLLWVENNNYGIPKTIEKRLYRYFKENNKYSLCGCLGVIYSFMVGVR